MPEGRFVDLSAFDRFCACETESPTVRALAAICMGCGDVHHVEAVAVRAAALDEDLARAQAELQAALVLLAPRG